MKAFVYLFTHSSGEWEEEIEFDSPDEVVAVVDDMLDGEALTFPGYLIVERIGSDDWLICSEDWGIGLCDTATLKQDVLLPLFQ